MITCPTLFVLRKWMRPQIIWFVQENRAVTFRTVVEVTFLTAYISVCSGMCSCVVISWRRLTTVQCCGSHFHTCKTTKIRLLYIVNRGSLIDLVPVKLWQSSYQLVQFRHNAIDSLFFHSVHTFSVSLWGMRCSLKCLTLCALESIAEVFKGVNDSQSSLSDCIWQHKRMSEVLWGSWSGNILRLP